MTIRAFTMQLLPGSTQEYRARHDAIWPELKVLLTDAGIYDYSIFLDHETLTLFACLKLRPGHTIDDLPSHPVMQKWWAYMAPLMVTEPSFRPVGKDLEQVFYLE